MTGIRFFFRSSVFLSLCALLMLLACRPAAQTALPTASSASTLTVEVTGLHNDAGKVHLTLFRDEKPVDTRSVEIDAKTRTAKTVFEHLPKGTYAVYMMHDENGSGKMEFSDMGVPLTGYGMSNNPAKRPGRPGFDETNFKLDQPALAIEIKTIYW